MPKHVLIPVFTEADVSAIPETLKLLRLLKPLAVVVVNCPSLGISPATATAQVDKQIADLERAKTDAAAREDYEGAKQFKSQIEDAKMKRVDILRDGWKQVSIDDRGAVYDRLFMDQFKAILGPLGVYVRNTPLTEDSTPENLLSTLANFGSAWPDCLPHSQYAIVWPQSVNPVVTKMPVESVSSEWKVKDAPEAPKLPQSAPVKQLSPRAAREKQLKQFFSLKKAAIAHGIPWEGRPSKDIFEEVIAKEFPEAVAA